LAPTGPPTGESKVLRGGSWANGGALLRCSARFCYPPTKNTFYAGFRCVEDVAAK
jgi:formylglycine-generating enzyme required for sulfatase activity